MKKILILILAVLAIASCKKEDVLIPEGLFLEESSLTFVPEGETYMNRFYTTDDLSNVKVSVPAEAQEWLSVVIDGKFLKITVARNNTTGPRSATIAVTSTQRNEKLSIKQNGLPSRQLKITGGTYTSSSSAEGSFLYTYDGLWGDGNYWHSDYSSSPSNRYVDQTLTYFIEEGAENLDMLVFRSRYNANGRCNGRWGYYCVYVKGDGTDTPSEVPGDDIDWEDGVDRSLGSVLDGYKLMYKGDESAYQENSVQHDAVAVLPMSVPNPVSVRILIKCGPNADAPGIGRGGYATLAEIELFGKVN